MSADSFRQITFPSPIMHIDFPAPIRSGVRGRSSVVSMPRKETTLNRSKVYWLTSVLMMAFATIASATTIVLPSDDQLIAKSPLIVEGTVVSSTPIDRGNAIWTETKLAVSKTIKGDATGENTIRR